MSQVGLLLRYWWYFRVAIFVTATAALGLQIPLPSPAAWSITGNAATQAASVKTFVQLTDVQSLNGNYSNCASADGRAVQCTSIANQPRQVRLWCLKFTEAAVTVTVTLAGAPDETFEVTCLNPTPFVLNINEATAIILFGPNPNPTGYANKDCHTDDEDVTCSPNPNNASQVLVQCLQAIPPGTKARVTATAGAPDKIAGKKISFDVKCIKPPCTPKLSSPWQAGLASGQRRAAAPAVRLAPAAQAKTAQPGHSALDYRRVCAISHAPGIASCMALLRTGIKQRTEAFLHGKAPSGDGYGPSDLVAAYDLPTSSTVQNVAVVDVYNDPNAVSDLATYRSAWGLPACDTATGAGCLTVTNEEGQPSPLPPNVGSSGWDVEESLDTDMVSAICPSCHIFLVEASAPSITDLGTAVNSAVSVLGASYVSNSYGASESSSEATWDTDYYRHPGVAVTASAGDSGYGVSYPAASQYITAVGGTTLTKDPGVARGWTETVWGSCGSAEGTGSGSSQFEPKPSWQTDLSSGRTDNDVAADANPNTGVAIYDTYSQGGWLEVGGTSVGAPLIASVFALAGTPAAGTYPSSYPYADTADLYDVTRGSNSACNPDYLCTGEPGYDGPTGWGTPNGTGAFSPPAG